MRRSWLGISPFYRKWQQRRLGAQSSHPASARCLDYQVTMAAEGVIFFILVFFYIRIKSRRALGIFSRDDECSYPLLLEKLRSETLFTDVRTFTIWNYGWQEFRQEVSRCDYAVLYHSKNRGRVNVTDVTDSLYDEELTYLSTELGKENVFVVVDDLDSSMEVEKQRILHNQPLIQNKARDLILFSRHNKRKEIEKNIQIILQEIIGRGVLRYLLLLDWVVVTLLNSVLQPFKVAVTLLVLIPSRLLQAIKSVVTSLTSLPFRLLQDLMNAALSIPATLLGFLGLNLRKRNQD